MRKLVILAALAASLAWPATQITDTLYTANGEKACGTIEISWPTFTTADGRAIAAGSKTITVPCTSGAVSVSLEANEGATPSGTAYTARYYLKTSRFAETWVVGATPPVTLREVRKSSTLVIYPAQIDQASAQNGQCLVWSGASAKWLPGACATAVPGNVNSVAGRTGDVVLSIGDIAPLQGSLDAKLVKASNLSDVADVAAARVNLGLGDAATKNTGTAAGTVALGNHAHTGTYEPANANIQTHIARTDNPHNTSAAQVGAAASSHSHTAVGDVSGDLGVTRVGGWQGKAIPGVDPGDGQIPIYSTSAGAWTWGAQTGGSGGGMADPGSNGLMKRTALNTTAIAGPADLPSGIDAAKVGSGNVSSTEFEYLDGATSNIQGQLAGKAGLSHSHTLTGDVTGSVGATTVATVGGTSAATVGAHPARTDNPHSVTAAQVGAVATGGAYADLSGASKIGTGAAQVSAGNHAHAAYEAVANKDANGGYVGRGSSGEATISGTMTANEFRSSDTTHTTLAEFKPGTSGNFPFALTAGNFGLFFDSANGNKLTKRDSSGTDTVVEGGGTSAPPSGTGYAHVTSGSWDTPSDTIPIASLPPDYYAAATGGASNAYVGTLSSGCPAAYVTGELYTFKADAANSGAATYNFCTLGVKTIKKPAGGVTTDLAANDIRASQIVTLRYDGTNMQMMSQSGNAPGGATIASTTVVLKGDNTGNGVAATAGVDFAPAGATKQTRCEVATGTGTGGVLQNTDLADLAPSILVPVAVTVIEVTVRADNGTPNMILQKHHGATAADLVSGALATAASGGVACAATGAACLDGTAKSGTVSIVTAGSANVLAAGDWISLKSGTAGGTAKWMSVCATYTVN